MSKKLIIGIAIGAGVLALAAGAVVVTACCNEDETSRKIKKAARRVKKESKKIADLTADKVESFSDYINEKRESN